MQQVLVSGFDLAISLRILLAGLDVVNAILLAQLPHRRVNRGKLSERIFWEYQIGNNIINDEVSCGISTNSLQDYRLDPLAVTFVYN